MNCYIVITRDVLLTVANFLVSIIVLIRMYKKNQIRNSYENLKLQKVDNSIDECIDELSNQNFDNSGN